VPEAPSSSRGTYLVRPDAPREGRGRIPGVRKHSGRVRGLPSDPEPAFLRAAATAHTPAQDFYRDPTDLAGTGLSDALRFAILP
jgi:hypothetical protein